MECVSCFDEITYMLEYRDKENSGWKVCKYCKDCIQIMKETQFLNYVNQIKVETCKKSLKRLLELGPPTKVREILTLPCENEKQEVWEFRLNEEVFSSKLENVYQDEQMVEYIEYLKNYLNSL